MSIISGSFDSAGSIALGVPSGPVVIPSNCTSAKLSLSGLDASNTVKTQKSTNNGQSWADQVTYNSVQTNTAITVVPGEHWRLVVVAQQVTKHIDYRFTCES